MMFGRHLPFHLGQVWPLFSGKTVAVQLQEYSPSDYETWIVQVGEICAFSGRFLNLKRHNLYTQKENPGTSRSFNIHTQLIVFFERTGIFHPAFLMSSTISEVVCILANQFPFDSKEPGKQPLLQISVNFTPKNSHSSLRAFYEAYFGEDFPQPVWWYFSRSKKMISKLLQFISPPISNCIKLSGASI